MSSIPPKLRKAAILISALDAASADALLEQMSEADARRVRMVMVELDDIDAAEQEAVISEFLGPRAVKVNNDDGVELELSTNRFGGKERRAPTSPVEAPAEQPFKFLSEADPERIAPHLLREHPQTIAVVLAHLPPSRAAEIVKQLPEDVQTEVLLRIGRIEEMNSEVVRDVERGLEAVLAHELKTTRQRGTGVAALEAILEASGQGRSRLVKQVAQQDRLLATQVENVRPHQTTSTTSPTAIRPTRRTPTERATPARTTSHPPEPRAAAPSPLFTVEFAQLQSLDDRAWARILRATESQVALLALAGAPTTLVKRLLRQLPPREARLLERKMEQLGPVRLRDIERAQQQIARIAAELASEGEIRLPEPRAFATSA
jgi:flagellar motor switch protein FliG